VGTHAPGNLTPGLLGWTRLLPYEHALEKIQLACPP
jgi:hypothetical protein